MRLVGRARLLICTVPIGIAVFAASWTVTRQFAGQTAEPIAVAAAVHKLVSGELLREARPPASPSKDDPGSHDTRRDGNAD
jgi:hypothetical protein